MMKQILIKLVLALFGGCVAMILHELPKALVYKNIRKNLPGLVCTPLEHGKTNDRQVEESQTQASDTVKAVRDASVFRLFQYIDPVGLIFCGTCYAGLSRPYAYAVGTGKSSRILGITGFCSLACQFLLGCMILRFLGLVGAVTAQNADPYAFFTILVNAVYIYTIIVFGMFLSNLFPLTGTDFGMVMMSESPNRLIGILKGDYLVKVIWLLCALFGFFTDISGFIVNKMI